MVAMRSGHVISVIHAFPIIAIKHGFPQRAPFSTAWPVFADFLVIACVALLPIGLSDRLLKGFCGGQRLLDAKPLAYQPSDSGNDAQCSLHQPYDKLP